MLAAIDELRKDLRFYLRDPRRWFGTLRRATLARAVQGSNSIEGYHASVEDVAAVIEGEEPLEANEETRRAIEGYRDAMTYVLQLAAAPAMPAIDESLLKSLHFMMLKYDLTKNPGQWRPGAIWVEDQDGNTVYRAPDRDVLEPLVHETLAAVNTIEGPAMVRGAMAHLNLVLVHPFSDGNGRMARCLQSFVLASDGIVSPEFSSIEEYLGRNTLTYYRVLTDVAQGEWSPNRSPHPWIRFCLTAHYRQALTLLRRIRETEALWDACEQLVATRRLPDRTVGALSDAARGWRLRRALYRKSVQSTTGETISDQTATRDLVAMSEARLLEPFGERRGRQYRATSELREI
ncbi:MAG TPA: Fic family protein, partial [Acidimicrobiales bacterium]|nr:Fic family protein [Acidimicrobiales bacterium]